MSNETTTHLSQLPNNNDKDNDLVNKILSELENISEEEINEDTDVLSVEESPPSLPAAEIKPKKKRKYKTEQVIEDDEHHTDYEPAQVISKPTKINTFYNSINFSTVKNTFRMSTIVAILFFVFTLYNNTFVNLFSKLPILKINSLTNELTTSGKFLQGICFGLTYFFINIFYFDN